MRFRDDFKGDLSGWELVGAHAVRIRDSGDPEHGRVLELEPDGSVAALVKGSDQWGPLRIEADVLFPDDLDNYFGLIYHYTRGETRTDFGSVYIKGNGSYIRVNPWRDGADQIRATERQPETASASAASGPSGEVSPEALSAAAASAAASSPSEESPPGSCSVRPGRVVDGRTFAARSSWPAKRHRSSNWRATRGKTRSY